MLDEAVRGQEMHFLEDFFLLLQTAHFKILTEEEYQTASDNDFTVKTSKLHPAPNFKFDKLRKSGVIDFSSLAPLTVPAQLWDNTSVLLPAMFWVWIENKMKERVVLSTWVLG